MMLSAFRPLLLILLLSTPAYAASYRVVSVADGDTITVLSPAKERIKVRLYGIDCPERKQPYGRRATETTKAAVYGKPVEMQDIAKDRYGRTVGLVMLGGESLSAMLVREGMAWVYTRHCTRRDICGPLREMEDRARAARKGLWRDREAVPPWEWRRR